MKEKEQMSSLIKNLVHSINEAVKEANNYGLTVKLSINDSSTVDDSSLNVDVVEIIKY